MSVNEFEMLPSGRDGLQSVPVLVPEGETYNFRIYGTTYSEAWLYFLEPYPLPGHETVEIWPRHKLTGTPFNNRKMDVTGPVRVLGVRGVPPADTGMICDPTPYL